MTNPTFLLSREADHLASARELRRMYAAGLLTRVVVGVYMLRAEWQAMDADERYRARVRAIALTSPPGTQFSHDSAAAMMFLPRYSRGRRRRTSSLPADRAERRTP